MRGDFEILQLLLARGADASLRDARGARPFDVARNEGMRVILAALIGARPSTPNPHPTPSNP